jgi:thymidine phosphorylase
LEEEKEILKLISTITKKMVIDEQMTNYMMAIQHEKIVIDSLYAIYR